MIEDHDEEEVEVEGVGDYSDASGSWESWLKNFSKRRAKKEKGYSATKSWSNRYDYGGKSYFSGGYGGGATGSKDVSDKYNKILGSVTRSANVVRNSSDEGFERRIIANWSDGKSSNSIKHDKVFISPDVCDKDKTRKSGWTDDEKVDVLVGEVLTYSTMKRTGDPDAESSIDKIKKHDETLHGMAACLWHAAECLESEREVLSKYPGFDAYYSAFHEYYLDKDAKSKIEGFVKESKAQKLGAVAATLATEWEMLHPDEKLELDPEFRELVDWANGEFFKADSSIKKARAAQESTARFVKLFPPPPSKKKSEGDGEGEDGEDKDGAWKPAGYPMVGLPRKKLNARVKNEVDAKLPNEMVDCPDADTSPEHKTLDVMVKSEGVEAQYDSLVSQCRSQINQLKSRLKLRNEVPDIKEHGLRRGDLDEGSIYKLGLGRGEHTLFEEATIIQQPKLAFGLLIDESGSMGGNKSQAARRLAVILAEAMASIKGVSLCVLGHTGEGRGQDGASHSGVMLHHYYTPEHKAKASMVKISAFSQNLDGYALMDTCNHMQRWYPSTSKYIVLISDGQPAGNNYGGLSAEAHVGRCSRSCRAKNTQVMGVGILKAYTEEQGARMYGQGNFVVLNGVDESISVVANFVSRVIRNSCVMQG